MVVFCTNNAKQALGSAKGVMPGTNCSFFAALQRKFTASSVCYAF
jgi:hypothetical protein